MRVMEKEGVKVAPMMRPSSGGHWRLPPRAGRPQEMKMKKRKWFHCRKNFLGFELVL